MTFVAIVQKGDAKTCLAISDKNSPDIHIFDISSSSEGPIATLRVNAAPVMAMKYNHVFDTVISADRKGNHALVWNRKRVFFVSASS